MSPQAHASPSAQVIVADTPSAGTAVGKSTLTQKLPPRAASSTGVPLVDQGLACDRSPDGEGCVDPQRRAYAITVLSHVVGEAMANFRDALQDKRLELLTEKEEGPGILVDALIVGATGPLVGLGVAGASRLLRAAASQLFAVDANRLAMALTRFSFNQEALKVAVGFAAKKAGDQIKGLLTSSGKKNKGAALKLLRNGISIFSNELITEGVTRLKDDVEVVALSLGYADQEFHSVSAYTEKVDLWLSRYDANGIENVGEEEHTTRRTGISAQSDTFEAYDYSHGELAWVTLYTGEFRLALLSGKTGKEEFKRLIDRDFETTAVTMYMARKGRPPTRQHTLSREEQDQACAWADRSWTQGLVGCDSGRLP